MTYIQEVVPALSGTHIVLTLLDCSKPFLICFSVAARSTILHSKGVTATEETCSIPSRAKNKAVTQVDA